MDRMVILTGEAGVGKDTYADRLTATAADDGISVHRITFARVLKDMAEKLGWDGRKDKKGRTLLQELGKLVKEYHGQEFFAEKAFEGVKPQEGKENLFIVTDLRFLSEFNYAIDWANQRNISCTVVRIDRDRDKNWTSSLTEEQKKDISENSWKTIEPDVLVHNDGTNFYEESLLNSRFDLSDTSDTEEMDPVSPEEIKAAEKAFVEFMKQINPEFEMPGSKKTEGNYEKAQ